MAFVLHKYKNKPKPGFYKLTQDVSNEIGTFQKGTIVEIQYLRDGDLQMNDGKGNIESFVPTEENGGFSKNVCSLFQKTQDIKVIESTIASTETRDYRTEYELDYKKKHPIKYKLMKFFDEYSSILAFLIPMASIILLGTAFMEFMSARNYPIIKGCTFLGLSALTFGSLFAMMKLDNKLQTECYRDSSKRVENEIAHLRKVVFDLDELDDKVNASHDKEKQSQLTFGDVTVEQYDNLYLTRTVKEE